MNIEVRMFSVKLCNLVTDKFDGQQEIFHQPNFMALGSCLLSEKKDT